jgi:isopenicillin-N N-acyltransferase-like protein
MLMLDPRPLKGMIGPNEPGPERVDSIPSVSTPRRIDLHRVKGTPREAGAAIGEALGDDIRAEVEEFGDPPEGRTRGEQLSLASRYRDATAAAFPGVLEELDGAAEACGIDPLEMFAASIEEIWHPAPGPAHARGCSDLVAAPPASADGHVLVGHNNDLGPSARDRIVAIEREVDGEPLTFTLGIGPWPSVGWNETGVSFTGNELSPNDERIGVPRLLQFRAMLAARTIDEAVGLALHHERASSYNNLLADARRVVNVEGSATEAELVEPAGEGILAHTNHYACASMLPREGDEEYARHSAVRLERAMELLEAPGRGGVTRASIRGMLADHERRPDSLCRHEGESQTVFWCVADVTDMRISYGRGNPCDSAAQAYSF